MYPWWSHPTTKKSTVWYPRVSFSPCFLCDMCICRCSCASYGNRIHLEGDTNCRLQTPITGKWFSGERVPRAFLHRQQGHILQCPDYSHWPKTCNTTFRHLLRISVVYCIINVKLHIYETTMWLSSLWQRQRRLTGCWCHSLLTVNGKDQHSNTTKPLPRKQCAHTIQKLQLTGTCAHFGLTSDFRITEKG